MNPEKNKPAHPDPKNYEFIPDLLEFLSEIPAHTIISRTFYADDKMKAILFGFAAGQELSEHTAARPAILHFLSGEAQITLGEDAFDARAGTWAHMQAHLSHSIVAKTPTAMLLLML